MAEDDWDGMGELTERIGERTQLVGDDIFVTNPAIFRRGIDVGIASSILIKLNQIGGVHRDPRHDRPRARVRLPPPEGCTP